MLSINPSNNKSLITKLAELCLISSFHNDIAYILYQDEDPIGIAALSVENNSAIDMIGVLPSKRGFGFGDFFTRSILNRLGDVSETISIQYVDDYYLQFGFKKMHSTMFINAKDLNFPRKCEHKGE